MSSTKVGRVVIGLRTFVYAVITVVLAILLPLALAELIVRRLPLRDPPRMWGVDSTNPVSRFRPNQRFVWSVGWDFEIVNRGHTNNEGWANDSKYSTTDSTPMLAVIGDSYVEALMVDYDSTLHGRLARAVAPKGRVYSFGTSGAPLSEYLALARFAEEQYRPDLVAVVIVGNDFDESHTRYKSAWGFHYFYDSVGGLGHSSAAELGIQPPVDSGIPGQGALGGIADALHIHGAPRRWGSAAVANLRLRQYLMENVNVGKAIAAIRAKRDRNPAPEYVGNTAAKADSIRLRDSYRVTDEFLARLPGAASLDPNRIILVLDGVRPIGTSARYSWWLNESYFGLMRRYLIDNASRLGFTVVDLQPRFVERFKRDRVQMEWGIDGHWNPTGHGEAAAAIAETAAFRAVFGEAVSREVLLHHR